ncbi:hypothetical protein, partial [Bradyrhizobium sp. sBnM-33]|uniref:hypothetical protein n=1 Tax=Bradyrhizobium sp. sBnM-33 TaxID=2831780 RepID=UPI001BCFDF32
PARMIVESLTPRPGIREHYPLNTGHGCISYECRFDGDMRIIGTPVNWLETRPEHSEHLLRY